MLEAGADLVVGLEPHLPYTSQFWAIKQFLPEVDTFVLPYRLEEIAVNNYEFDVVFSMGVIYHRQSPIDHILAAKKMLETFGRAYFRDLICGRITRLLSRSAKNLRANEKRMVYSLQRNLTILVDTMWF